ncbi:MAG: hypothetical protein L0Z53_00820 [Acidobacteriales bacterium]|nr:hypothetical protein [Terriglobales bacterium]
MSNNGTVFNENVPARLQYALTKSILENYKQASRYCFRHFASPQAKDLSGVFRRAKIEDEMPGIAALFRSITAAVQQFENNTGFYYELTCGVVKLTQSCISDPNLVPRYAKFRSTLAQNGQLPLFTATGDPSDARYLYAILTHGVDINSEKRSWPAFVKIQFPNETCSDYVDEGIDLLERFSDLKAQYVPSAKVILQLKQRRIRKEEGA